MGMRRPRGCIGAPRYRDRGIGLATVVDCGEAAGGRVARRVCLTARHRPEDDEWLAAGHDPIGQRLVG